MLFTLTMQLKLPVTSWHIARSFKACVLYGWIQSETSYPFVFLFSFFWFLSSTFPKTLLDLTSLYNINTTNILTDDLSQWLVSRGWIRALQVISSGSYGVRPRACSPTLVQSSSPRSTLLSWELMENTAIPAWKQVPKRGWWRLLPPAEVWKSKSLACFGPRIDPEGSYFLCKTEPKIFWWILLYWCSRRDTQGHRNPRFKSMPWLSIKMVVRSEKNPRAQSDKDTPRPTVPSSRCAQDWEGLKSDPCQQNVVTRGLKAFPSFDLKFHPMSK